MKAVIATQSADGKELDRVEAEYEDADAAKAACEAALLEDAKVTKVIVYEDLRPLPPEGQKGIPNVHDPKIFVPRIIYQRHHETKEAEIIGESWP